MRDFRHTALSLGSALVLMLILLPGVFSQGISCSFTSTCSGTALVHLRNDTGGYWNSHTQNFSGGYPFSLCCSSPYSLSATCGREVFRLSNNTNAHVQTGSYSGPGDIYPVSACLSSANGSVSCEYPYGECGSGYECIASMASSDHSADNLTDSHLGPCSEYLRKVCCMVSAPDEPAEPDPDGGGGASFPITSETALLGQEISVEFTLSNMRYPLETNISVSITDCPQGWECGSAEIPSLLENEEITVFLPISVPVSTEQRTYRMGIEAVSDQRKLTERLHVTVSPQCNDDFQCSLYERCRSGVCTRLFDIEIERADSPVKPGDFLDFSYTMKEMSGISDDVTIRYWLEGNETVEAEGSEVIYIGPFDEKREDANLYVPEIARGRHMLFVELSHEQYTVQSSRSVVVSMSPELRIDLDISDIPDIQEGRPVPFSFYLGSNLDKPSDVGVEISLLRNGVRRWYLSREMTINRTSIISEAISGLEPGDYVLSARVSYGARTTSIARSFRISGWFRPEYVMLLAIIASLALLSLLLVVFMRRIFRQKELIPGNE